MEAQVVPAALELCRDPVAVVRVAAADQMGQLLASDQEGARPRAELLSKSLRVLSREPGFQMRQVYIYMCYRLIGAAISQLTIMMLYRSYLPALQDMNSAWPGY